MREKPILGSRGGGWKEKLRDLFFGIFYYGMYQQIVHTARKYKDVVHVLVVGELLGVPSLSNYYTLRLLPYVLDEITQVKKIVTKDYDVLELLHEGLAVH